MGHLRLVCRAFRSHPGLLCGISSAKLRSCDTVAADRPTITSADVAFLHTLPALRRLVLNGPHSLYPVRTLTRLETLMVDAAHVRAPLDCEVLTSLGHLSQLQLNSASADSRVGNLAALTQLTALTGLSLGLCLSAPEPLQFPCGLQRALRGLPGLRELTLVAEYRASEPWLALFAPLQQLTCLDVCAAALPACSTLSQLEALTLHFFEGPTSLQHVSVLSRLSALELVADRYNASVTEHASLRHLPSLRHLSLQSWQTEDECVHAFGRIASTTVTSLRLKSGGSDNARWQCQACRSLQQLEVWSDYESVTSLRSEDLPPAPQQFTLLVLGDLADVTLSADLVSSGRMQVKRVRDWSWHSGSMDRLWQR